MANRRHAVMLHTNRRHDMDWTTKGILLFLTGAIAGWALEVAYVSYQLSHAAGRSMTLDDTLPIVQQYHEQRREAELAEKYNH